MKYHFKIYREKTGFWAEGLELKGCITQANTFRELRANIDEAINLYLEEPDDSDYLAPLPDRSIRTSGSVIEVPVDFQVASAFKERYLRIQKGLSQQAAME